MGFVGKKGKNNTELNKCVQQKREGRDGTLHGTSAMRIGRKIRLLKEQ